MNYNYSQIKKAKTIIIKNPFGETFTVTITNTFYVMNHDTKRSELKYNGSWTYNGESTSRVYNASMLQLKQFINIDDVTEIILK